jgi:hypothetical protein
LSFFAPHRLDELVTPRAVQGNALIMIVEIERGFRPSQKEIPIGF